jgi:hypothetical protein
MSTSSLTKREAVPVTIGGYTVYCESFKASSVRDINESPTVVGGTVITSNSSRTTKLVFSGRICSENSPADFIFSFNDLVHSAAAFSVSYMELVFNNCHMLAYSFADKGGNWADISVTLVTADTITRSVTP